MIYDAVIIGAGPAGTYAGTLLAKAGLNAAIVDRRNFPRDKLCGGLLTCKTIELLRSILPVEDIPAFGVAAAHVFYQGQSAASFQLLSPVYTVRRIQFDALLLESAESQGLHAYLGTPLQSVDFTQKELCLSDGRKLKYSVLIGADGVLSTARRLAGLPRNEMGFCVEAHVPWDWLKDSNRISAGGIEIYYGDYPNGYGWIFPCKDSAAVGVGNLARGMPEKDILTQHRRFLGEVLLSENVKPAGAYLPSGTSVALGTPQYEELCLIGDAAGLIDPFTGEGIYTAFLSAQKAVDSILSGKPPYPEYELRMERIIDAIRDTVCVRDRIYSPDVLKHSIGFLQSAPQYSECLIDETIIRYTKSYADAYEEIKFYSR